MRASGRTVPVEHAAARPGEQQRSFIKVSKSKKTLGWEPQVQLEAGLGKTFEWFRALAAT
jgi:UDP-glucose 4-epimerase